MKPVAVLLSCALIAGCQTLGQRASEQRCQSAIDKETCYAQDRRISGVEHRQREAADREQRRQRQAREAEQIRQIGR